MSRQLLPHDDLFDKMAEEMGAIMDSMMAEMNSRNYFRSSVRDCWEPQLNVYELPDRYVVCADLAGMERREIDVSIDGNTLHVRGDRPRPTVPDATSGYSVLQMEIDSGKFHREVALPGAVDGDATRAVYRNGYVWIILPRAAD